MEKSGVTDQLLGRHSWSRIITVSYEMTNDECRLTNGGIASGFVFGYDPTRRSVNINIDRSTKDSRQGEYLKSKIRIPKSKICFYKVSFPIRRAPLQRGQRGAHS